MSEIDIDHVPALAEAPIAIETTMIFEDFEEGVLAVQLDAVAQRQRSRPGARVVIFGLLGIVGGFLLIHIGQEYDSKEVERPEFYVLGTILAPTLVYSICGICLMRYLNRKAREPLSPGRRALRLLRTLLPWTIIALSVAVTLWLRSLAPAVPAPVPERPVDWFGALYPHSMWVAMTAFYFVVLARNAKPSLRKVWEKSETLHRTNRVSIDAHGVSFEDGFCTRSYRWDAFIRFRETSGNLLLLVSEVAFEAIAKREFASKSQLEQARATFIDLIIPPAKRPTGFPVSPIPGQSG